MLLVVCSPEQVRGAAVWSRPARRAGAGPGRPGGAAEHLQEFPDLHEKFWNATKLAGESKKSLDPAQGQKLIDAINEIADIFKATKAAA